jgi:hypothetical protein
MVCISAGWVAFLAGRLPVSIFAHTIYLEVYLRKYHHHIQFYIRIDILNKKESVKGLKKERTRKATP